MVQSNFKQICLQPFKYYSWREISEMGYFFFNSMALIMVSIGYFLFEEERRKVIRTFIEIKRNIIKINHSVWKWLSKFSFVEGLWRLKWNMLACLLNLPQEARLITPCKLSSSFNYFSVKEVKLLLRQIILRTDEFAGSWHFNHF